MVLSKRHRHDAPEGRHVLRWQVASQLDGNRQEGVRPHQRPHLDMRRPRPRNSAAQPRRRSSCAERVATSRPATMLAAAATAATLK